MKTQIAILLILSCLTFSSCKKDSQDLIVGTWALDDMYDSEGKKLTTNGKFYYPFSTSPYDYFSVSVEFDPCANTEDSCDGRSINTIYFKDPNQAPKPVTTSYKYIFLDNSTLVMGSTKYKIAKITKKKLEIYPVDYDKSIRTYNRK